MLKIGAASIPKEELGCRSQEFQCLEDEELVRSDKLKVLCLHEEDTRFPAPSPSPRRGRIQKETLFTGVAARSTPPSQLLLGRDSVSAKLHRARLSIDFKPRLAENVSCILVRERKVLSYAKRYRVAVDYCVCCHGFGVCGHQPAHGAGRRREKNYGRSHRDLNHRQRISDDSLLLGL